MAARLPVVDVERPLVKIELPHQTACGLRREAAKRETTLQRLAVELLDLSSTMAWWARCSTSTTGRRPTRRHE
jgi:hypothetical protein